MLIFEGRNRVTQAYGGKHGGIDIVGDDDRNVHSVKEGIIDKVYYWDGVTKTGTQSYGNLVTVKSSDNRIRYYAHLDSVAVKPGQYVKAGEKIGVMGNTGNSFGAHTHYEVRSLDKKTKYNPATDLGIANKAGVYKEDEALNGWVSATTSFYYYENGEPVKNRWIFTDGWWYRVGDDGKMLTGYIQVGDEVFYLDTARTTINDMYIPLGACIITDSRGNFMRG